MRGVSVGRYGEDGGQARMERSDGGREETTQDTSGPTSGRSGIERITDKRATRTNPCLLP